MATFLMNLPIKSERNCRSLKKVWSWGANTLMSDINVSSRGSSTWPIMEISGMPGVWMSSLMSPESAPRTDFIISGREELLWRSATVPPAPFSSSLINHESERMTPSTASLRRGLVTFPSKEISASSTDWSWSMRVLVKLDLFLAVLSTVEARESQLTKVKQRRVRKRSRATGATVFEAISEIVTAS